MAGREGTAFGPYRLVRRLGSGAAGEVYTAEGPSGDTAQVAVKVLYGGAADATTREIARQSQAVAALQLPHVIPLFGPVQHEGALAIAMALAPGGSLGDTLRSLRPDGSRKLALPLSGSVVARLVTQIARALAVAHAAGFAHGDLKPNNIFVRTSPTGQPLAAVSDFGQSMLAQTAVGSARGATGERGAWAASQLLFTAPEQLRGETQPASDQYALAAIVYSLLTGETPLVGDAAALLAAIPSEPVTAPAQLNPAIPSQGEQALLRALAKDPRQRYATIEAFAQALDEALAVPAGVGSGPGTTQEFARLASSTAGMRRPGAGAEAAAPRSSGLRVYDRSRAGAGSGQALPGDGTVAPPEDPSPRARRPLTLVAATAVALVLLSCVLGFRAFESSSVLPHIRLGGTLLGGPAPTATPDPAFIAAAHTAEGQLQAATRGAPAFSDDLKSNQQRWRTSGTVVFFAPDGLHLHSQSTASPVFEDTPGGYGALTDIVAQVDVTMVGGTPSDDAGLRFFVQPADGGQQEFYAYLITSEGRYAVWFYRDGWHFVHNGYSSAIKLGMGQTNTLAVLARGSTHEALFFANGKYVTSAALAMDAPAAGPVGFVIRDGGSEARFARYRLYAIGG